MELKRGRHSVYLLTAHLVFVTKRRGNVFEGQHLEFLKPVFESVLIEFNGECDHVHLLVSYPPKWSVSALVNSLKGVSSRRLKQAFPDVETCWSVAKSKNALWSPSYFASSTGGAPIETLKKYIENQNRPA